MIPHAHKRSLPPGFASGRFAALLGLACFDAALPEAV